MSCACLQRKDRCIPVEAMARIIEVAKRMGDGKLMGYSVPVAAGESSSSTAVGSSSEPSASSSADMKAMTTPSAMDRGAFRDIAPTHCRLFSKGDGGAKAEDQQRIRANTISPSSRLLHCAKVMM